MSPNLRSIVVGALVAGPSYIYFIYPELVKQRNLTSLTIGCPVSLTDPTRNPAKMVTSLAGMNQLHHLHLLSCGFVGTCIPDCTLQGLSLQDGRRQLARTMDTSTAAWRRDRHVELERPRRCFQQLRQLTSLTQLTQLGFGRAGDTCGWPAALATTWEELAGTSSSESNIGWDHNIAGAPGWAVINKVGLTRAKVVPVGARGPFPVTKCCTQSAQHNAAVTAGVTLAQNIWAVEGLAEVF
jgi:hypothetical protein